MTARPNRLSYPVQETGPKSPPDYQRIVSRLTLRELCSELESGGGTEGYRRALSIEADKRRGL